MTNSDREERIRKYLAQSGAVDWPHAGPLYYVTARLLWDVDRDPEAVIRQWNHDMYGPAAAEMMAWYDATEQVVVRSGGHYGGNPLREVANVYQPDCFRQAHDHLEKAVKLADNDLIRQRILRVKDDFEYGMLGVDAISGKVRWDEQGDAAGLQQARQAATQLLSRKGIWGGISMQHFKDYLDGVASASADAVRWQGWGKPEQKGGRMCRNSDETGPGDGAAGWASFSTIIRDPTKPYRVTMEVWGESQLGELLICSRGRAKGSSESGVWKPLPRQGRLTGKPEWCTLTFKVPSDMFDREIRRQSFGFGGADSQVWVAEIRVEMVP